MFVHSQSFEDLTAESEEQTETELNKGSDQVDFGECAEEIQTVLAGEYVQEEPLVKVQKERNEEEQPESRIKEEDVSSEAWRSHRKHVFVLSEAGKPIYSRYGTEEALSSTMGVMMALVSFVEAGKNIIRSIHAGKKNISGQPEMLF